MTQGQNKNKKIHLASYRAVNHQRTMGTKILLAQRTEEDAISPTNYKMYSTMLATYLANSKQG